MSGGMVPERLLTMWVSFAGISRWHKKTVINGAIVGLG